MSKDHWALISRERELFTKDEPSYLRRNDLDAGLRQSHKRDRKNAAKQINAAEDKESKAIEDEIEAASYILEIANDADEPNFVAYSAETLGRATTFLRRLAIHAHSCGFSGFGAPDISPAHEGSVDLLWTSTNRKLLMNFPSVPSRLVTYYGKKGTSEISGRFEWDSKRPELIYWLVE